MLKAQIIFLDLEPSTLLRRCRRAGVCTGRRGRGSGCGGNPGLSEKIGEERERDAKEEISGQFGLRRREF